MGSLLYIQKCVLVYISKMVLVAIWTPVTATVINGLEKLSSVFRIHCSSNTLADKSIHPRKKIYNPKLDRFYWN